MPDALDVAEEDEFTERDEQEVYGERGNAEDRVEACGDIVGLHAGEERADTEDRDDGEEARVPPLVQFLFDGEDRAVALFTLMSIMITSMSTPFGYGVHRAKKMKMIEKYMPMPTKMHPVARRSHSSAFDIR